MLLLPDTVAPHKLEHIHKWHTPALFPIHSKLYEKKSVSENIGFKMFHFEKSSKSNLFFSKYFENKFENKIRQQNYNLLEPTVYQVCACARIDVFSKFLDLNRDWILWIEWSACANTLYLGTGKLADVSQNFVNRHSSQLRNIELMDRSHGVDITYFTHTSTKSR